MMPQPEIHEPKEHGFFTPFCAAVVLGLYVALAHYVSLTCANIPPGVGRATVMTLAEGALVGLGVLAGWLFFRFSYDADHFDSADEEPPGAA